MQTQNTSQIETPFMAALYVASELGGCVPILRFISIYLAEVVFSRDWKIVNDGTDSESLFIKRYCKDKKSFNGLQSYTREALYNLIEVEWNFSNPQMLLPKGESCWAYSYIAETQELSLDGFILKRGNFPKKELSKCGTMPYQTESGLVHHSETVEQVSMFNPIKEEMVKMYDRLIEIRSKECKFEGCEYVWQWLITPGEYAEIKRLLIGATRKQIDNAINENVKCSKLVAIYVAEHFKREYNGQNASKNILDDKGYSTELYKKLIGKNVSKVYRENGSGDRMWKDTLQAEGGLPIGYIVDKQNSNIANIAEDIYNDELEAVDKLQNSALRQSYQMGHSICKFVKALTSGVEPICSEEDRISDVYRELYKILETGRDKIANKFYLKYSVWKSKTQFIVKRTLIMRECNAYDESPTYVISSKRLTRKWGVDDIPYTFWLKIETDEWRCQHQFIPCSNSVDEILYRSHIRQDEFALPKVYVEDVVAPVTISYMAQKGQDGVKIEEIPFLKDGYKQFYQASDFEWREGKGNEEQRGAVLFDKQRWRVEENNDGLSVAGQFCWVEFEKSIKLYRGITEKSITLISSTNGISMVPTMESMHKIAKLSYVDSNQGVISLEKIDGGGVINKVYLLQTPVQFQIIRESGVVEIVDCEVDSTIEGYKPVVVKTKDGYSKKIPCYFLPSDVNIRRDSHEDSGTIFFDKLNVEGVNGKFYDTINNPNLNFSDDYVEFSITDGEYRFKLNVVRPFDGRRDRFRGVYRDELGNAIPIRYSGRYRVRVMNKDGVQTYTLDKVNRSEMMDHLFSGLKKGADMGEITLGDLKYCIYTNDKIVYHKQEKFFYVDSGTTVDDSNLIFKFLSLDDNGLVNIPFKCVERREQGRLRKYLVLDFVPKTEGIILQSIYDDRGERIEPFRCYRPIFVSVNYNGDLRTNRFRRVQRMCQFVRECKFLDEETTFKHFEVALKCGCYIGAMDRLMSLVYEPSCRGGTCEVGVMVCGECPVRPHDNAFEKEYRLARFYVSYVKYCNANGGRPNYEGLKRLSEEIRFDWIAIRRGVWERACLEYNRDCVIDLFKRLYPTYESLISNYWNIQWRGNRGRVGENVREANELLNYVINTRNKGDVAPLLQHPISGLDNLVERLMNI